MTATKYLVPAAAMLGLLLSAAHVAAQEVKPTLERVAAAWHRGDASAIAALGAEAGITLDVDGTSVGPLGPRQAAAVLRRVFSDRESVRAAATMTRTVGGDPTRAFGEVTWTMRMRGTTIPQRATIFFALALEDGAWRITEIRLLQ